MTALASNYLDPQTLAAIAPIDLRARMIVEGLMQGLHRSPYQGFSIEFAQHRQYAPGDDTRFLDWKVYGKTDKLYLKQYQRETNLDMLVLVDVSGSMAFSSGLGHEEDDNRPALRTWRKFDHAAALAAAMAYLALRQQDRVGLVLFSDRVKLSTRLSNARDHWRTVAEALATVQLDTHESPAEAMRDAEDAPRFTDLRRVFDQVTAKLTQRSLIVLISDLFDHDEHALEQSLARLHHRRHDVIVLQTLDHAELEFPYRKASELIGLEAEGRLPIDPQALRQGYLDALKRHLRAVEEVTRRFQFDYLTLDTSQSLGPPLSHFLARRASAVGK